MLAWRLAMCLAAGLCGSAAGWTVESPDEAPVSRYNAKGRRDPFLPLVRNGQIVAVAGSPAASSSRPVLYGILWDPSGQSLALVNDREVRVGDVINGYHVKAIRQDAVVLQAEGGEPIVLQIEFEPIPGLSPGATTGGEDR